MRTLVKISEFLHRDFYRSQKQLKMGTFEGMFVIRLQLKRLNFSQWESLRGLVDTQRMCLSRVSSDGGRTV